MFLLFLRTGKVVFNNDLLFSYLGSLGYTGTVDDRLYSYLLAITDYTGAVRLSLQDLLRLYFDRFGIVSGSGTSIQDLIAYSGFLTLDLEVRRAYQDGTVGLWLDPADFSSMFQDAAGTQQVTALGQTVQLMLDKSRGLSLGSDQKGSFATAMSGTATTATYNTTTGAGVCYRIDVSNKSFVRVTGLTANRLYLVNVTNTGSNAFSVRQNTDSVVIANVSAGQTLSMYVSTATHTDIAVVPNQNGQTHTFTINSVREIAGNHVRFYNTTLQSVNGARCLRFNGTSSYGVTLAPIVPGSDKVTVIAGVRKNSDAARGCIVELGNVSPGAFRVFGPDGAASPTYTAYNGGSLVVSAQTPTSYAAPVTNVVTIVGDISADALSVRVNGTQVASSSSDQGSGNYGTYNLFIGARNGASAWFNGDLFGLDLSFASLSTSRLSSSESFIAKRTGVTL